ncbi:aromatic amino acid DMT transporter YddG [Bordetella genomosp. 12]|uniref:EamA family transporter n=1 Tax=Bordetella genomosp. 12 TaxID=463035 RepID=A0A261VM71_9BORD|nr:aromatic amino acid DMT transporter YddG [Bordetella genomosp. 12]OZI75224.1 EamA family transporter [Bordetella genomosp. 12]
MPSSPTPNARATAIGLLAVVCWSAVVGLMRSIAEALGPAGGAACLFSVSALLVCLVRGLPALSRFHPVYLYGCGALFAAYEICLALAIGSAHTRAEALELGMINYLWPSLTIVVAVLARQARGNGLLWPGAALSFFGIIWITGAGQALSLSRLQDNVASNPIAYALAFAAAGLWAAYSVLTRLYGRGENGVSVFLLLTALALWIKHGISGEPSVATSLLAHPTAGLQVLVLGALVAIGYSCWNLGIQKGNMAFLAAASYFTPVLSALLAAVWLQQEPGTAFWQGVAMVTLGSLICWYATRARA